MKKVASKLSSPGPDFKHTTITSCSHPILGVDVALDIVLDPNVVFDFVVNFDFACVFIFVVRVTFTCTRYVYLLPFTLTFAFYDSAHLDALRFSSTSYVLGRLRVTFDWATWRYRVEA